MKKESQIKWDKTIYCWGEKPKNTFPSFWKKPEKLYRAPTNIDKQFKSKLFDSYTR